MSYKSDNHKSCFAKDSLIYINWLSFYSDHSLSFPKYPSLGDKLWFYLQDPACFGIFNIQSSCCAPCSCYFNHTNHLLALQMRQGPYHLRAFTSPALSSTLHLAISFYLFSLILNIILWENPSLIAQTIKWKFAPSWAFLIECIWIFAIIYLFVHLLVQWSFFFIDSLL